MTREHSPRPGVTWQQEPVRTEVVLRGPDGPEWSIAPYLDNESGESSTAVTGGNEPWPPLLNRADRRRAERAQRKRGRS